MIADDKSILSRDSFTAIEVFSLVKIEPSYTFTSGLIGKLTKRISSFLCFVPMRSAIFCISFGSKAGAYGGPLGLSVASGTLSEN